MDHGLQSTKADFGKLAREFSHRAYGCQHDTDRRNIQELHLSDILGIEKMENIIYYSI
jgi:hypothetical protein